MTDLATDRGGKVCGDEHVRKRSAEGWLCGGEWRNKGGEGRCTDQRTYLKYFARGGGGRGWKNEAEGGRDTRRGVDFELGGGRESSFCRLSRPAIVTNPRKSHKVDSKSTNRVSVTHP